MNGGIQINGTGKAVATFAVLAAAFSTGTLIRPSNEAIVARLEAIASNQQRTLSRMDEHSEKIIRLDERTNMLQQQRLDDLKERDRIISEIRAAQEQIQRMRGGSGT